tara:strand:+ start:149 stop:859 length:711 start_codon:yes stop_codon:yes gene_type:complete
MTKTLLLQIKHFWKSLQKRGFLKTLILTHSTLFDNSFDKKYKLKTNLKHDPKDSEPELMNVGQAEPYVPVRYKPFLGFLQRSGINPDLAFVDLGCGKGRAMIIAAEYGFKKIRGVEFSKKVHDCAQKNINQIQPHYQDTCFELFYLDVLNYQIRPDDSCFFLYHPFDKTILEMCLSNIQKSVEQNPRKIFLIYHDNLSSANYKLLYCTNWLSAIKKDELQGNIFTIFSNKLEPKNP